MQVYAVTNVHGLITCPPITLDDGACVSICYIQFMTGAPSYGLYSVTYMSIYS